MNDREKILELLGSKGYIPLSAEELAEYFRLEGEEISAFISLLDEMYEGGLIFKTKRDKYVLSGTLGIVTGTLRKYKKGFGFVVPALGDSLQSGFGGGDIYVAQENLKSAMDGDLVAVKLLTGEGVRKRREGAVARILRRAHTEMVGTFYRRRGYGFLVPDDPRLTEDVFISEENRRDAQTGDKVAATILQWPEDGRNAEGAVTEIVSRKGEPGGDIKALIRQYRKTKEFSAEVQAEAEAVERCLPEKTQEQWDREGRRDLRKQLVVTIDGADSKDFDDAVSVKKLDDHRFLLSVHIADVTHYVKENHPLDQEAFRRGTSIYILDQVIPMLPQELSNGICSLNPAQERLTLSVDMEIDGSGQVLRHEIYEAVIRSQERMVYDDVSDMLEFWGRWESPGRRGGEACGSSVGFDDPQEYRRVAELCRRYKHLRQMLLDMEELAGILRRRRQERGSIDFDLEDTHISLNEQGVPVYVGVAQRRVANKIIEDFMITANETVAEHVYWMGIPFIYRVHDRPQADRISELKRFLGRFGLVLKGSADSVHSKALSELLEQVAGMEEEQVIHTVTLRAMQKAVYSPECRGHFGLGLHYYCHFTSPIRRYPDLMIHRIIKETLRGELTEQRLAQWEKLVEQAAVQSSAAERQAQEMEREAEKMKMAEYMESRVGERFSGIISGVAQFGFFVQLENTVEGLVRAAELNDDYYEFQQSQYRLIGSRHHRVYALGDRVTVQVVRADAASREIDFALAEEAQSCGGRGDRAQGHEERRRESMEKRGRKRGRASENKAIRRRKFRK